MNVGQFAVWALLTGGITGAVWVAIVMFRRERLLAVHRDVAARRPGAR